MAARVKVVREVPLCEFAGGRGESVRVRLVQYEKGAPRLDIRKHFTDDAGQVIPTSRGIGLKAEWLPQLREALDRFEREAKT